MDETILPGGRFHQVEAWRRAHELVLSVYRFTETLPETERLGLVPQLRSAAVSVPANIVEGGRHAGGNEKIGYYGIARSSLEVLRYYIILCRDLGFTAECGALEGESDRLARLLHGLIAEVPARTGAPSDDRTGR